MTATIERPTVTHLSGRLTAATTTRVAGTACPTTRRSAAPARPSRSAGPSGAASGCCYDGKELQFPLPADQGTGLGKALKLINHPVRDRIPIILAAVGPKNTAMAAELAEGWQPIFYFPEKAAGVWGASLAAGRAKRDASLAPLDVIAQATLAIGDDVADLVDLGRPGMALYIGGMGARGQNFYTKLASGYGYPDEAAAIQDAYLDGRKDEAAALVPRRCSRASR